MATQVRPKGDLYAQDFYVWTEAQAGLLRERKFEALDHANLIEDVGLVTAGLDTDAAKLITSVTI